MPLLNIHIIYSQLIPYIRANSTVCLIPYAGANTSVPYILSCSRLRSMPRVPYIVANVTVYLVPYAVVEIAVYTLHIML